MYNIYSCYDDGFFEKTNVLEKHMWINVENPSKQEIEELSEKLNVEEKYLDFALDKNERARIDVDNDVKLIIIKTPVFIEDGQVSYYNTLPLGVLVIRNEYLVTICSEKSNVIKSFIDGNFKFGKFNINTFIARIFYENSLDFLKYLNKMEKETQKAEKVLEKAMKNEELVRMLNSQKSIIYFSKGLELNDKVLQKMLMQNIINFDEKEKDIIEDAIIENEQSIETCEVFSKVLASTMNAYSSAISNNLNIVMKFLASITSIFTLTSVISGFYGMNVKLPYQENEMAYVGIIIFAVIVSVVFIKVLRKKDLF